MSFHIGQKIVCVDDTDYEYGFGISLDGRKFRWVGDLDGLTKGRVYTVRHLQIDPTHGRLDVLLQEIRRGICFDGVETGFRLSRFRPLIERKTDISAFTKILDDVRSKEPVE